MSKPAVYPAALSEQWVSILNTVEARLDDALAAADRRAAALPMPCATSVAATHRMELSLIAERILRLHEHGAQSQALANDEDLALGVAEDALRLRLAAVASLRQKLAASPGRAIL
jgi:hypothetical protein